MIYYDDPKNKRKLYTLENFHRNLERKLKFGVSIFDCDEAVKGASAFFGISVPDVIKDLTDEIDGATYVRLGNRGSMADDELSYSLDQLFNMGITGKEALSLIITHEFSHRVLQDTHFPGLNNGSWEQELCCDFFMGVRASLDKMSTEALNAVRNGLGKSPGSDTHPTGHLRYEVISHGYMIGNFDLIQHRHRSFNEYLKCYWDWLQKNAQIIRQEQISILC